MKITNISAQMLKVAASASAGNDQTIPLKSGEVAWIPNSVMTNSILIYQRKRLLAVSQEEKPDGIAFYTPYHPSTVQNIVNSKPAEKTPEPVKQEPVKPEPVVLDVQNVRGDIKETSEGLAEAKKEEAMLNDQTAKKGEITDAEFKDIVKAQEKAKKENSLMDEAQGMVDELKTGKWSDEEVKILRRTYPRKGLKASAEKLNRSETSVREKVKQLKLRKIKKK